MRDEYIDPNEVFKTTDMNLAATLRCQGVRLIRIEVHRGSQGTFVFPAQSPVSLHEYDMGECRVEPIAFGAHVRSLTTAVRRATSQP